jgi:ATP-dependent Clp protease ATP-binding subunit ClpB
MSEYMEKHSVSRLVGAPPGYVGYDEGGQLTEAVRRRPYAVVLLDDGRLTDGQGRTVDFRNALIVMTSNLGSDAIRELSDDRDAMVRAVNDALRTHFRPELLNRIDETVIFRSLELDQIERIVTIQLGKLAKLLEERGLTLDVTPRAVEALAREGYDPAYGARPLKRAIQRAVQNPLALKLLEGGFAPGSTVRVDSQDGAFTFEAVAAKAPRKSRGGGTDGAAAAATHEAGEVRT